MGVRGRSAKPPCWDNAIEVLDARSQAWWLMVEAGDVDWGSHANNIDNSIGAVISGDNAFKSVTEWIEQHGGWDDTALILTNTHGDTQSSLRCDGQSYAVEVKGAGADSGNGVAAILTIPFVLVLAAEPRIDLAVGKRSATHWRFGDTLLCWQIGSGKGRFGDTLLP
jgi:hypothetical protein